MSMSTATRLLGVDFSSAPTARKPIVVAEGLLQGRVLRLHPLLNSIGIPNWFELQFLHNGYFTAVSWLYKF